MCIVWALNLKKSSDPAYQISNTAGVVERPIRTMGGDIQTEVGAVIVVGRPISTLSLPCSSFCAPSTNRGDIRLASDHANAVEESKAGRDVLEEFRDVVLAGVERGREQVAIIFRNVDRVDATDMVIQGTQRFCGLEVPKNDGVVVGASSDDALSGGGDADGFDFF